MRGACIKVLSEEAPRPDHARRRSFVNANRGRLTTAYGERERMRSDHDGPLAPSARGPSSCVLASRVAARSLAPRRGRRALLALRRKKNMRRLLPRVGHDIL